MPVAFNLNRRRLWNHEPLILQHHPRAASTVPIPNPSRSPPTHPPQSVPTASAADHAASPVSRHSVVLLGPRHRQTHPQRQSPHQSRGAAFSAALPTSASAPPVPAHNSAPASLPPLSHASHTLRFVASPSKAARIAILTITRPNPPQNPHLPHVPFQELTRSPLNPLKPTPLPPTHSPPPAS